MLQMAASSRVACRGVSSSSDNISGQSCDGDAETCAARASARRLASEICTEDKNHVIWCQSWSLRHESPIYLGRTYQQLTRPAE
eukprot:SAG25_NODE_1159_length_3740_cov_2.665477_4_plen_84_part_00